jgi:hypothetical protein
MSRLSIEIDPEQHRKIKTLAPFAGMSIKDYILMKALAPQEGEATDALLTRLHKIADGAEAGLAQTLIRFLGKRIGHASDVIGDHAGFDLN